MTALDILVLLAMAGAGALGLKRGLTLEILSLGAWVLAIATVKVFHGPVTGALTGMVGTEAGAAVLAFALIFGLTMLGGRLIARTLGEKTKNSMLGNFDRFLGLGFGAFKGLLGVTLLFLFVALINDTIKGGTEDRPGWMTESRTYPLLNAGSRALVDFVGGGQGGDAR